MQNENNQGKIYSSLQHNVTQIYKNHDTYNQQNGNEIYKIKSELQAINNIAQTEYDLKVLFLPNIWVRMKTLTKVANQKKKTINH